MTVSVFAGIIMYGLYIVVAVTCTRFAVAVPYRPEAQTDFVTKDKKLVDEVKDNLRRTNEGYKEWQLAAATASPLADFWRRLPVSTAEFSVAPPAIPSTVEPRAYPINPAISLDVNPAMPSIDIPNLQNVNSVISAKNPVVPQANVPALYITVAVPIFAPMSQSPVVNQDVYVAQKELAGRAAVKHSHLIGGRRRGLGIPDDNLKPSQHQNKQPYFQATDNLPAQSPDFAHPAGLQIPVGKPQINTHPPSIEYFRSSQIIRQDKADMVREYMALNRQKFPMTSTTLSPSVRSVTPSYVPGAPGIGAAGYGARAWPYPEPLVPRGQIFGLTPSPPAMITPSTTRALMTSKTTLKIMTSRDPRAILREAILGKHGTVRPLTPAQLDLAPAKGSHVLALRFKGRLCQRNVMKPEGPKYNAKGKVYIPAFKSGPRKNYASTKPALFLLPRCCNCCKKSVLGCE